MYWQSIYHVNKFWRSGLWLLSGVVIGWCLMACADGDASAHLSTDTTLLATDLVLGTDDSLKLLFTENPNYMSTGFDFPVGKPDAKKYYNAQPFGKNNHLGDDWNGNGGGNTDIGDSIYSISEGLVTESVNFYGGWGNVTRVAHSINGKWKIENGLLVADPSAKDSLLIIESLYAHSKEVMVKQGDWVKRGQQIATIGNAEGVYLAHLHFEIRERAGMELGGGYATDKTGYLDPTAFVKANRKH